MSIQSVSFGNLPNQPKATKKTHKGALIGGAVGLGYGSLNIVAAKSKTGKQIATNTILNGRNKLIANGIEKKIATKLAKQSFKLGVGLGVVVSAAIGAGIGALVDRAKNKKA